jgi:DNA-directed RNA polymerase beta subunit
LETSTKEYVLIKEQKPEESIGFYASNFLVRLDMDVNLLHLPQNPIVKSIMLDVSDYSKHPAGQNVILAVMSYKGYNMEDSIVINKGSIERGMGDRHISGLLLQKN